MTLLNAMTIEAFRRLPHFRGRTRLLNYLTPRSGARCTLIHGCEMKLDLHDHIPRMIYFGSYELRETALVKSILRPGMTFIDVGANIGYYCVLGASLCGLQGRVVCIEPSAFAYQCLVGLVEANGLSQVVCHQVALGSRPGTATLFVPPTSHGNHDPSLYRYTDDMTGEEVSVDTLDNIVDRLPVNALPVELLKVDVEGHEQHVLLGGEKSLSDGKVRHLLLEFHAGLLRRAGTSPSQLHRWLEARGFVLADGTIPDDEGGCANLLFRFAKSS